MIRARHRGGPVAGLWLLGLLLGLASTAEAAEPSSARAAYASNEGRADQLFRSGEKKFDAGDYPGACSDFSESLKLGPKLGTLLNLALCHETVGRPVTAWHEFSHGAAWAAQNNQRERYEFALQHVKALEPKLPRVVLQLPAERAISGLDLDGEPLAEQHWYLPLYLDPGEHRLAITAPGKARASVAFRVTASPSDQLVYVPPLADETNVTPMPEAPQPQPDTTRRALGLVGLGIGVVGVVVGTTFGVLAATADARDPVVKDRATIATIGFVSGAVFAAAGGWLLWTSAARRTAVVAAPRTGGGSVSLTTSF